MLTSLSKRDLDFKVKRVCEFIHYSMKVIKTVRTYQDYTFQGHQHFKVLQGELIHDFDLENMCIRYEIIWKSVRTDQVCMPVTLT